MTKARARKRAKAKVAVKGARSQDKGVKPEVNRKAGKFNPETNSMRNLSPGANVKSMAGMKRGSARSR